MTSKSTTDWDALAERLDNVQKPVQLLKLCQDTEVRERFRDAEHANEKSQKNLKGLAKDADEDARAIYERQAAAAATELAEAQAVYDAHVIVLRFTALERQKLEQLQKDNPPSETDEAEGKNYAMDTFAPALISAASLDRMPVDAAHRYLDTWSAADAGALWNAAWSIQHRQRTDLGKG